MTGYFLTGAIGYPLLELAWRGRTHYSMALAGGASMVLIRAVSRLRRGLLLKSTLCAAGITAVEYAAGLIWNRRYRVWDYRRMPMNLHGQICLSYSLLWLGLSAAALTAMKTASNKPDSP